MPQSESGRVLLVDDEFEVRQVLARVLTVAGYRVDLAENAASALALLENGANPDVIIADLRMSGAHGIQFLQSVRERNEDVPVIIITGEPSIDSAMEAIEYGGYRYLKKPVARQTLVDAVRSASAVHRLAVLKRRALLFYEDAAGELSDRRSLTTAFERAMDCLWIAFQPIVDSLQRGIVGYEALVRSNELRLATPQLLLNAAVRLGRMTELGRRVREVIASNIERAPGETSIFVNLSPTELNDEHLYLPSSGLAAQARRVVLEVTERSALEKVLGLREKTKTLRDLGFRIAVGELGAGHAGLSNFIRLEPDIVKLDMSLIRGIDDSPNKQILVRGMISVCSEELGLQVVCEGVETELERDALHAVGAKLLQGYLFARPMPRFCDRGIFEQPS